MSGHLLHVLAFLVLVALVPTLPRFVSLLVPTPEIQRASSDKDDLAQLIKTGDLTCSAESKVQHMSHGKQCQSSLPPFPQPKLALVGENRDHPLLIFYDRVDNNKNGYYWTRSRLLSAPRDGCLEMPENTK